MEVPAPLHHSGINLSCNVQQMHYVLQDLMNQTDFDIGLLVGATAGRCEPVGALVMNFGLHYQYLKESQGTYTEQEVRERERVNQDTGQDHYITGWGVRWWVGLF